LSNLYLEETIGALASKENIMHWKRLAFTLGGLALFLGGTSVARANSILVTNAGYSVYQLSPLEINFNYSATLDGAATGSNLRDGDGFTIYDFKDYVSGSESHPGGALWAFSTALSGGVQPFGGGTFVDDPNIDNLTWIYHGPTIPAVQFLGIFSAATDQLYQTTGGYSGMDHGGNTGNEVQHNQGLVLVASDIPSNQTPVPVPAAVYGGLGLMALGGLRKVRSPKA
jgi:hypothetical protein